MIRIEDKQICTGCYACLNICPEQCVSMNNDNEGFWYPVVDNERCIDCGLCVKVCPIINRVEYENKPITYACINNREDIRLESSSGGIFTLIAEQIIACGGIVFGARFDDNFNVIHDYVDTKEGLQKFRGSKYLQSRIGETFKEVEKQLEKGRKVLFSGTPCQIAGLKSFLDKPNDSLFTVDIICHGVPSPLVWQKYIEYREAIAGSKARRIAFRRKDEGWKLFSISFIFENDKEYIQTYKSDLYMRAFLKDICLRPSCYNCQFKTLNRDSDITLADFWGIQNILPEMDDNKGTSLLFVNSKKGLGMFEEIKGNIISKKVDINEAVSYNLAAVRSSRYNPKREDFFREIDKLPFEQLINKYCSNSVLIRIKRKIKLPIRTILKEIGLLDVIKNI
ncbi:MAG: 4Fe-4S dicluster domain-containing protein [Clostridiales bacterium]|nr:4Fe-4S dicluster domain-containing protein [Clostridiales bacterium]